ncbi:MAG TPA: sulfate adenylyltransferase [Caldithrix abyssi]|uniref:Sulfate adenylyltransferase n=1 Tax=Caldithrix abyssi TaxID=187145 RepID=A0A7V4UF76_CALAY|nr:sulfate adenylyltransferase [Caldithrix abyssi]
MSSKLVPPHGGELKPLMVADNERAELMQKAQTLPAVRLTSRETSDLIMLSMGAFSPLDGFMRQADYVNVVKNMHLDNGLMWPIPITVSVTKEQADTIAEGSEVALYDDESGELMGMMTVEEKYTYDKKEEAQHVFRTDDEAHPGVAKVYAQHDILLGGPVKVFSELHYPKEFAGYYARPAETRAIFEEKGWTRIAGFQTRNPIHRSHEYVTKIAMEVTDGVLIHPLVGKLKAGDIPADVRMKCYEVLIDKYYVKENVVLKVYPMEMRYGGPREALLHAIFRQNFGCSHLIIGRDHAGVGSYYGPFDAQKIFDEIPADALHIQPLNIDWTFYCHKCEGMASMRTCPHGKEDRVLISGTKVREMLGNGEMPPQEFTRPEVGKILMDYYQSL